MLERDELKIAVEDARARQTALVQLMYFLDTQAMNFLRTYITIEAAVVSAIVVAISNAWPFKVELLGSLFGLFGSILVGSFFCFRTMRTVTIILPGRGPEFWTWALDKEISHDEVALAYLQSLEGSINENRRINEASSKELDRARFCGLLSPFIALGGALIASACYWLAKMS